MKNRAVSATGIVSASSQSLKDSTNTNKEASIINEADLKRDKIFLEFKKEEAQRNQ